VRYQDEPSWRFDEESYRNRWRSPRERRMRSDYNRSQELKRRSMYYAQIRNSKTDS